MLRSALIVAPLAQVAFGAVANFCVEDPFKQMQHFRDFEPAISRCAVHYPAQTVTKTVSNQCLTMTETVILGTSTIHATNHLACATPHLEVRAELLEDVYGGEPKGYPESYPKGYHDPKGYHEPKGYHHHEDHPVGHHREHHEGHHDHYPGGYGNGGYHHRRPHTYSPKHSTHKTWHNSVHTKHLTYTGGPGGHTKHLTRTYPQSIEPYNTAYDKRAAGPTPAAIMKRDAQATKSAEWFDYYAGLAACGYDCIQTACSCVGSAKTVLETPVPTCTSTKTKVTVVHVTTTIDVEPTQC